MQLPHHIYYLKYIVSMKHEYYVDPRAAILVVILNSMFVGMGVYSSIF